MANFALTHLERLYAQVETTYGIIPNTTGTATVGNSNACRFIRATLDNEVALIDRPDKTGTLSMMVGVRGRSMAKFSVEMSIAPNGTAGVVPDFDPYMQCMFGQAGTVMTGSGAITAASNASPIVITHTAHGYSNNDMVFITGVTGNTAANGLWLIASVAANTYALVGSTGNAAYVSGGTDSRVSVKYALSDTSPLPSLAVYSFRQPSTIDQRCAHGAIISEGTFQLGADVATMSMQGEAMWALESNQFSAADTTQKGGLTAFPSEPSAPVTNGGIIAGFTGLFVVNGNTVGTIRTASVRFQTGRVTVKDNFGTYYPTSVESDRRNVGITFSLYEDDSTTYANLIAISEAKTPVTIPLVLGTATGSMFALVLQNVQIATPSREEQRRFIANFPECRAHGSSLTARDELTCWVF